MSPSSLPFDTPGRTWFFTVALRDRGARHLVDEVADLRTSFAEVKASHPFTIDAMVVLPDHLHAVWTLPADDADFASRWALLQQSFTRRLQATGRLPADAAEPRRKRQRGLWPERYWQHRIAGSDDFARHLDYIHFNPVKHGLVLRARDWPYSSLHRYVRQGRLPADWGISAAIDGQFGE